MTNIGIQNLIDALARHTRVTVEGNWVVGAGATTSTIPVTLADGTPISLSPPIQEQLTFLTIEFTDGSNRGTTRQVVSVGSDGTLNLDTAVANVPTSGTTFVLMGAPILASNGSAVSDLTVASGTRAFVASGDETAFHLVTVNGTYRINGAVYATTLTVNLGGEVINGPDSSITLEAF